MLSKYSFGNFCSFKDINEFDMVASPTKVRNRFLDNFVKSSTGIMPLKTSVIVGENAGGKSNFIRSLSFLKSLFRDNQNVKASKTYVNTNNICSDSILDCDTNQIFEFEVIISNVIFEYYLEIDVIGIVHEKLFIRKSKNGKKKLILDVKRNDEDTDIKKAKSYSLEIDLPDELEKIILNNIKETSNIGLFISKIALLGNEYAVNLCKWMNDSLYAESILIDYDVHKDFNREEDDLRILKDKRYIEILRMVDYSINNIEVDEEKPYSKTKIIRCKENNSFYTKELKDDSTGVREFFAWAVQIFRVVYENKVIFADEMDRVLNPVLSNRVISFINGTNHEGQFVFTTHNVLHLDLKNMMKEQIYFITKDNETLNSEVYSLADFPEIRYETTKIYEFYMKGVLGGTSYE